MSERSRLLTRLARDVLARGWGIRDARLRCVRDLWNGVFDVRAPHGRFLLRLHDPSYHDRRELASELRWLEALARDGLPTPRPRTGATDDGVYAIEDAPTSHHAATLLTWIEGRRVSRLRPPTLERLGALLAALHARAERFVPPPPFARTTIDASTLRRYWFHPHDDRGWRGLDPRAQRAFDRAFEEMAAAERALGRSERGLIHADAHAGNLLHTPAGLALVDFDDCGVGCFLYDLAVPLGAIPADADSPSGRALVAGYRRVRPLSDASLAHLDAFVRGRLAAVALFLRGYGATHGGRIASVAPPIVEGIVKRLTR